MKLLAAACEAKIAQVAQRWASVLAKACANFPCEIASQAVALFLNLPPKSASKAALKFFRSVSQAVSRTIASIPKERYAAQVAQ